MKSSSNEVSFYQSLEDQELIEAERNKYENIQMLEEQTLLTQTTFMVEDPDSTYTELYLTNYRIIIVKSILKSIPYGFIQSLHLNDRLVKLKLKTGIVIDLHTDSHAEIQGHIKMGIVGLPFCFNIQRQPQKPHIYDSYAEIQRMRIDANQYLFVPNSEGQFCMSYPCSFTIPKSYHIQSIKELKKCRNCYRIPVMSYFHDRYSVGIWRAAKLIPKLSADILKFDKAYLKHISQDLITITLEEKNQSQTITEFQTLGSLRSTYQKLVLSYLQQSKPTTNSKPDVFLKCIGKWYQQIDKLITLAYNVVDYLKTKNHVLIEELVGLDRSAQILSLCSIIIDPYYRTFVGLSVLIQKEFISFGHPFEERYGFKKSKTQLISPIFTQFLECVHQLIVTHPENFEYSSNYLGRLTYEAYTTKYKNFLEKGNGKIEEKKRYCPQCIWHELKKKKNDYNYQWNPQMSHKQLWQIRRKPSMKEYIIWNEHYDMITQMDVEKKTRTHQKEKFQTIYSFIHTNRHKSL